MATEPKPLSRVLLIDDDAISRDVLSMMFEIYGVAIDTADDGEEALAMLDAHHNPPGELPLPVIILMDTQMPGLSGLALVDALRQRTPARILAISGSEISPKIRQATDGFLLKPIEMESLVTLLESPEVKPPPSPHRPPAAASRPVILDEVEPSPITLPSVEPSLIDPLVLKRFKAMMSPAAIREIYHAVADDLGPRLDKLEAAMTAGNPNEVKSIAHSIKGGCSMVGLTSATEAAARLESSGTAINGSNTYPEELLQLRAALAALKGMLADEFTL